MANKQIKGALQVLRADGETDGGDLSVQDDLTVSGDATVTGALKYGNRTRFFLAGPEGQDYGTGFTPDGSAGAGFQVSGGAPSTLQIPLHLEVGERLKEVHAYVKPDGAVFTMDVKKLDMSVSPTGSPSTLGTDTDASAGDATLDVTGLSDTMTVGEVFYALFTSTISANQRVYGGYYIVDRP